MTDHSWIRKIFKSKFSRFVNKQKKNKEGQKPSLLPLEDRLVPAVPFVQTPFGANIQAIWSGPDNAQGKFTENPTFRVTFNYPVTGVDVSDFNINVVNLVSGSGTPSPSITQITPSEYILNVALPANSILPSVADSEASFTYIRVNLKNDATISPQVSFANQQTYTVGSSPQQVTMADVNRDGKLDIITANGDSNNVSVLLGIGNGSFGPKTDFATGTSPRSVAMGDVNGDGKLDIITGNGGSNNVSVLMGIGDGTFGPKTDFATGTSPSSVTLGDVNGDSKLDIITGNGGSNNVSVLMGIGNGTFGPKTDFATGTLPTSVTLGDVNRDGKLDIITANESSSNASVLLGNGNGTFQPKSDFATGTNPKSVTLGDVNGDGKLDIITANSGSANASVLLGNGNGTFQPKSDFATGASPSSVTLGDVNGDGRLDIITSNGGSNNASVLLGNGNGTFGPKSDFATGTMPSSVTLGDVNGDGRLDIISANAGSNTVSVLLGSNDGVDITSGFSGILPNNPAISPVRATAPQYTDIQFGDFNRDGILDIVSSGSGAELTLNLGIGNGTYKAATSISATKPNQIRIGDVDKDGKIDIVSSDPLNGIIYLFRGNGDGKFKAPTTSTSTKNNFNFELIDVNADGSLDIVTQIGNGSTNGTNLVGVLLNNGNGIFKAQTTFSMGTGVTPVNLAVGDVNGDGKIDIVTANYQSDSASILLGSGDGRFSVPTAVKLGDGPKMVALADMNNDGKLDLVSVNFLGNNINIAQGVGDGTFLPALNKPTTFKPTKLIITDMDGDGNLDVLAGGTAGVWLHPGNGNGSLQDKTRYYDNLPLNFAIGDANNDGTKDLLVAQNSNLGLSLMGLGIRFTSDMEIQRPNNSPPANLGATNGNGLATVNFSAVAREAYISDSAYGLVKYEYSLDGVLLQAYATQPSTTPSGPYIVTSTLSTSGTVHGLTNGTVYTLKVRGYYSDGDRVLYTGHSSVQLSPTAVPPTPAGLAPVLANATSINNNSASVSFAQPGGSPTGYEYNLNNTSWVSAGSSTSPLVLNNLTPGTIQSVRLRAVYNVSAGANPNSDASNEINFTTLSAPLAPLNLVAMPGDGSATIEFTAPSDGGSPITNYEYQVGTGNWTALNPVDITSPVTITGLTGGSALSIKLRGFNIYGGGTASSAVSVTPIGAPAAPTNTSVANSNGKATISFSINDGGAPITSIEYQISSNGGSTYSPWAPFNPVDATSPVTLSGLTNGTTYLVKLRGINSSSLTVAESAPITVAPVAIAPDAPTNLVALSGNGSATISFTAPDNGGSPITNYLYSINGGTYTALNPADALSPVVIPSLTNGTSYYITLKAVNVIGESVASTSVEVTPSNAKPEFVNTNTASFKVGTPASFSFMASGSPTWTILNLPSGSGLSLSNDGVLSGTPTVSGIYNLTVTATNAAGATTQAFTLTITGVPQFNTNDGTLFTQSSPLSYTVSANDPNNPSANTEIFNSNFSLLSNGWTVQGDAAIVNGAMRLTPAIDNKDGILTLPSRGDNNPEAFYAKFDLIATGGTGGSGADGTSFNYGVPNSLANISNAELTILSSGLSIGFVEHQSQRVEIRYNGSLLATVFTPIESANGRTVEVLVNHTGKLTLWMDGKAITTVDLGSAYTNAAKNTWQFGFGARTGTSNNRHEIDNLSISSVGISYSTGQSSFASNFSTLPTGWQIGGNTSISGGRLELNPSGQSSGYLMLPAMGNTGLSAFSVSFDYAASDELDDGLGTTLNYGVIPTSPSIGDFGDLLPGSGTTGLAITFSDERTDSISVSFNGNVLTTQNPSGINFAPNFQNISVTMTEAGYLTVTVGSTHVIKNLLVNGYASADKSNWKFGFGANARFLSLLTAGYSSHTIDNLQISGLQSLPTGIRLNPLTGLLSGTPSGNASSYGFNIVSTNRVGTATQAFTMVNTNNQLPSKAATYLEIPIEGSNTSGKTYQLAPGYTLPVGMFLTPQGVLRGTVPQHERGGYLVKFIATNNSNQSTTSGYYALSFGAPTATVSSTPFADPNPGVGNGFGSTVVPLATGNVLVHAAGAFAGKGALYLFNGYTGNLISSLVGSVANDLAEADITLLDNGNAVVTFIQWSNRVGAVMFVDGSIGWGLGQQSPATISASNALVGSVNGDIDQETKITKLPGGDYLVQSSLWDNGAARDAGAVTWGSGVTGVSGVISSTNSLVGTSNGDNVGSSVLVLANGNYLVQSRRWDNGTARDAGAVTFGLGKSGVRGVINSTNSLVGTNIGDNVGQGVTELANGNYVVHSSLWDNGTVTNAGAATWGSGDTGVSGVVSNTNSLVGTNVNDTVGIDVKTLANGNFVVASQSWNSFRGAFTWGDGKTGITGNVSATNSLVGSTANDSQSLSVNTLSNGNYVISLKLWDNGSAVDAGSVTWGSGVSGVRGVISSANSLVGSKTLDKIGNALTNLTNGNFVVASPTWDNNTITDAGAMTWVDGARGITGVVSAANSLVGSKAGDSVGSGGITTLTNGNFVVQSPIWDNSIIVDAGAVTWGDGNRGIKGTVSAANSLVGTTVNQFTGGAYVTALSNGNYVVATPSWDNGNTVDVGALTWANGTTGIMGNISAANSLIGTKTNDLKSLSSKTLSNGNIVFALKEFDNGAVVDAGALVWMNSSQPTTGVIGISNSLVGGTTGDFASTIINALPNGNYVTLFSRWDNGSIADAGAVTWGNGATGTFGTISATNSLVGTADKIATSIFYQLKGSSNYVLANRNASVNGELYFGSVTWANGDAPITGTVSIANSLLGSASGDKVGDAITLLDNGNYLVRSPNWDNSKGAVTFGNGSTGVFGTINEQNSLIGSSIGDGFGRDLRLIPDNKILFITGSYDDPNRDLANVGAVTLFDGNMGITGVINSTNSYIGNTANTYPAALNAIYDSYNKTYYAFFGNETVAGFSNNGAINPSVIVPNVNTAPSFTSPNTASFTVGNNDSFQITSKGIPEEITYSLQGNPLPSGITLSPQGLLSGTATTGTGATYTFTVRATNTTGFTDQSFTLTMKEAPVITSNTPLPAFVTNNSSTYPFTATGFPAPTFSTNDALPKGVTLSSSGILAGTPVSGTEGTYEFTVIATGGENLVAMRTFTLTVNSPVSITSASGTSAHNGTASTFQVKTTGAPPANSFSLTGSVPTGVTIDNNGLISIANTTVAGNHSFTVNASNGFGTQAMQTFTLEVFGPPSITSPTGTNFTIGASGSFQFTASGNPNTFTFSTSDVLPAGLVLSSLGVLSGTPEDGASGSFTVDVRAFNGVSSASQSFTIQIAKATSSVSLGLSSTGSINPGDSVTLTATVSGGSNPKGGIMTFKDGSTVIGTAKVDPSTGIVTFTTNSLASGSHSLTAEYSGNTALLASTSNAATQLVRTVSTTTVTSNNLNAAYQASVTFTATISNSSAIGAVDFFDGSTRIAQNVPISGGVATFSTSTLSAGPHSITAVYNGDNSFTTSTSSAISQSVIATSSTALASSANSAVAYNTAVTFTATVSGSAGTPTGTVQFYLDDAPLGTPVTLSAGVAVYTSLVNSGSNSDSNVPLPAGSLNIKAIYSGDSFYSNSASSVVNQVVNSTTATTVTSSTTSTLLGSTATFVARVTNTSGSNTPAPTSANISFFDGSTLLGTVSATPVTSTNYSEATFTISNLVAGNHSITAEYAGNPQTFFSNSESSVLSHNVVLNTTTTVTATPASAYQNDQVTFSATVARTSAGATPTGTITFFNGNTQLGSAVALVNGVATYTATFTNPGTQNITAKYSGNNGVTSTSEGSISKQILETQTTSTALASSANPSANGSAVTFTATVNVGSGTPTGTVTFFDGATQLGSAVTLVNGVATLQTSALTNGDHLITAVYTSNANAFGTSTSTKLNQRVNQAPTITSPAADSFLINTSSTFNFTATGFPNPSFSTLGILPKGLHLTSAGVLSGVPVAGTGGTYSFAVVASNDFGQNASVNFTLTVNEPASFTNPDATIFTAGIAESFKLSAKGFPAATFRVANIANNSLPNGLNITSSVVNNETVWAISGTPAVGTGINTPYTFVLEAVNNVGTAATQTFSLTINEPPSITSPDSASFTIGSFTNSFTVTAAGFPAPSIKLVGDLPAGVKFNNGVLSGTPFFGGERSYNLKFVASNGFGDVAIQDFTLNIAQVAPTLVAAPTTNDRTPFFSGTAEPKSIIELTIIRVGSINSTTLYKTVASDLNLENQLQPSNWSIDLGDDTPESGFLKSLADGNYIVMVVAIDVAGNRTTPITGNGTVFTFTVDATPPAVPVVGLASVSDTGVLGDLITSNTRPTITGTVEANSAITLVINDLVYTTTANGVGAWTVNLATALPRGGSTPMAALTDGKYEVSVTATDSFGNTSEPGIMNLVVDITAPIAPTITSPVVTRDTTPLIFGTAEINSLVTVVVTQRFNSSTISGPATFEVHADARGAWSLDLGTATPTSGAIQPLANNGESYLINANAKDAAGNQNNAAIGTQTLAFDRDTPEVVSSSLTNRSFPILSGKANAGDTLLVVVNAVTYSTTVNAQGGWLLDTATATVVTGNRAALTDGSYPVSVYYLGANPSTAVVAQNLVVDRTAPVISGVTASFGTILNQKNSSQPASLEVVITGIENEQPVSVSLDGITYTGQVFSNSATVTIPESALSSLPDGSTKTMLVSTIDRAGNASLPFSFPFTVDKSGPACPSFVSITTTPNGDIGTTPFTGYTQPVVTFRGEPGQTLQIWGPAGLISTNSYTVVETADTTNLNQPASFYVITFNAPQASGDFQIKLMDQNGNENSNETSPNSRANNFFNINSVPVVFDSQSLRSTQNNVTTGNLQVANVLNGQMFTVVLDPNTQQFVNPRLQPDGTWIDLDGEAVTFGLSESSVIESDSQGNPLQVRLALANESALIVNVNTGAYTYTPTAGPERTDVFQVFVKDASGNVSRLQLSFNTLDTLDRDGIEAQSENAIANIGGNQSGDLNQDGTADNRQASVSNLAWKTQQDFATATNPDTVQNTNRAAIITMVVNATAFDPSTTSTLGQLMGNVDPLAQLLQIGVLSTNGLAADQPNLYKPWDLLDFTVESLVSTGLNDINPNRDGTQIQVSIDISRANIPTTGLGFSMYRKLISASTISDYFDAGISLTDLAGAPITMAGWYDFTQRTPGGDGASFKDFNNDGKVDAIILTLTDNSFGDNNPIANKLRDPGTPGSTIQSNPGGPNPSVPTPPGSNPPSPAPTSFAATGTSTGSVPGTTVNIYPTSSTTPSTVLVPFANWQGEVRIARADINGDGNLETIATMGEGGLPILRVFDGATGLQTMEIQVYDRAFNGGIFVAVGDLGNDGILDFVTGAGNSGGPHVKIFNSITGAETSSFMAYDINFRGGVSVAVGDIDGSGFAAIVTGAGQGGGPHVRVFSGTDHSLIKEFMAYASDFLGGVYVAVGDYLSDGKYEIITGAGVGGGPHIKIWDYETLNLDGQTMAFTDFTKDNGQVIDAIFTGGVRVALADANGDNVLDILAGAGPTGGPRVEAFVGFRLELLMDFFSGDKNDERGVFVSQ